MPDAGGYPDNYRTSADPLVGAWVGTAEFFQTAGQGDVSDDQKNRAGFGCQSKSRNRNRYGASFGRYQERISALVRQGGVTSGRAPHLRPNGLGQLDGKPSHDCIGMECDAVACADHGILNFPRKIRRRCPHNVFAACGSSFLVRDITARLGRARGRSELDYEQALSFRAGNGRGASETSFAGLRNECREARAPFVVAPFGMPSYGARGMRGVGGGGGACGTCTWPGGLPGGLGGGGGGLAKESSIGWVTTPMVDLRPGKAQVRNPAASRVEA